MRLPLVRVTLVAAMLAGLLLSRNLWLTARDFPTVPVWDGLPAVPPDVSRIVFAALLVLLVLSAVLYETRWPVLAVVAVTAGWCLWDQMRWQPWVYQYLALFVAVGTARRGDADSGERALAVCRLVAAATYFWSGFQKLNVGFAAEIFPWVMEPVFRLLPDVPAAWVERFAWGAAGIECALGVGLLVPRLRRAAVAGVVGMHATLLFCLGPTGHDWNSVVWPWNVALATLVVLLFAGTRGVAAADILWPRGSWLGRVALVLFGVMPALNFVGYWDSYLSACLYSGNTPRARITLGDAAAAALPHEVREKYTSDGVVDLPGWALDELNVPPYPARRVFRGIASRLGDPADVTLVTLDRPHWRTGERAEIEEVLGP
ncbi:hypothetical protein J0H58_07180 [bacterium]|nr:hypothetical protein [bacterium]